jgi:hypothetical protein
LKDVPPKIFNDALFRSFFLENSLNLGVAEIGMQQSRHDSCHETFFDQKPMVSHLEVSFTYYVHQEMEFSAKSFK